MPGKIAASDRTSQDRFERWLRRFVPPPPGDELPEWIESQISSGAPRVLVPVRAGGVVGLHVPRVGEPRPSPRKGTGRRPLRGGDAALLAAYLYDVEGKSQEELVELGWFPISSHDDGGSGQRSARYYIRAGRRTGDDRAAFPWRVNGGALLPRDWTADPRFAEALAAYWLRHQNAEVRERMLAPSTRSAGIVRRSFPRHL